MCRGVTACPDNLDQRYARQLALPEIGTAGQEKLGRFRVLVVGVGGLGSPVALYLAGAGVGTIGIVDDDVVELSNLQRQVLHGTGDVGRPKVESAAETLCELNPTVTVNRHCERLLPDNAAATIAGYDFVVDATDGFASKFLIADACHFAGVPYSHAGILAFTGQTMTVMPGESACYRCLFGEPPPCRAQGDAPAGPLGAVAGVIGSVQATEAVKYAVGCGDLLVNRLLTYDALAMRFRTVTVSREEDCPLCGRSPRIPDPNQLRSTATTEKQDGSFH